MELLNVTPLQSLDRRAALAETIAAGDAGGAITRYLEGYDELSAKAGLEWLLAELVSGTGHLGGLASISLPGDLLERPSGACLAFVISQVTGCQIDPPAGLQRPESLPARARPLLAEAWLRRPASHCLSDDGCRHRLASWLAEHPPSIGTCLLAAACCQDRSLTTQLSLLWLQRGLLHGRAAGQINQASKITDLAPVARAALHVTLGRFSRDSRLLLALLEPALRLEDHATVLAATRTLLDRELDQAQREQTLAFRLAALAESDHHEELCDEYRRCWLPAGWEYPWPERLLYVFQQRGEHELEAHLLATGTIDDQTPGWVALARKRLHDGVPGRADLEAWEALFTAEHRDERVLVGLTTTLLACPPLLREEWCERLGLRRHWQKLAAFDHLRPLAGAYLVLLQVHDNDRIEVFESLLAGTGLRDVALRRAARAYIASLRRTRQWARLDRLSRSDDSPLAVCSFKEQELLRVMAALATLPPDPFTERRWCEGWERLLGLPLTAEEVVEVLGHFLQQRQALRERGELSVEQALLDDVSLQLLRRAKAEGEAVLAHLGEEPGRRRKLQARLRRAGLPGTYSLLQEWIAARPLMKKPTAEDEEETAHA